MSLNKTLPYFYEIFCKMILAGDSNFMIYFHLQASDDLMFTHVNMDALAGGEFFTRLAHKIVHSEKQIEKVEDLYNLMEKSIDEMEGYRKNFCKQQLQKGHSKYKEATNPDMPLSKVNTE